MRSNAYSLSLRWARGSRLDLMVLALPADLRDSQLRWTAYQDGDNFRNNLHLKTYGWTNNYTERKF